MINNSNLQDLGKKLSLEYADYFFFLFTEREKFYLSFWMEATSCLLNSCVFVKAVFTVFSNKIIFINVNQRTK